MNSQFFLQQIILQNFVTFNSKKISFSRGLNSIIGETGSGKSLILESIQLILGSRSDKKVIRKNAEFALIEATFFCEDKNIKNFFDEMGYPTENSEIVIKRVIHKNGTSKNFINNLSCTLNHLSLFAKNFIDLVGQFDNQKLLSEYYQLEMLDLFARNENMIQKYQLDYKRYLELTKNIHDLKISKDQREQRLDFLNYQIQEIERLNPSTSEELDLLNKKNKFTHHEKIAKAFEVFQNISEGTESQMGFTHGLNLLKNIFKKNSELFSPQVNLISQIENQLNEIHHSLSILANSDLNTEDIDQILNKLDLYQKLKIKYKGDITSIIDNLEKFKKEKESLESIDYNLEKISEELSFKEKELVECAEKLHASREKASKILEIELTNEIRVLNMKGATLKINLEKDEVLTETGYTKCFFLAETNVGEGYFKIKDIASGGELSRILLSMRQILASPESISIFLFDEIDSGIGGETANIIGSSLKKISSNGQVIAITHLPQIAQFSDQLILVKKDFQYQNDELRTESFVEEIFGEKILDEARSMVILN